MSWPERKEEGAARALPRAPSTSCVEASPHRALFTPAGQTKASLSSAGVGHQRAGRRGRAGEGGRAGRKEQGEEGQGRAKTGKSTDSHTPAPGADTGSGGQVPLTHGGCHRSPLLGLGGLPASSPPAQPRLRSREGPSGPRL